MIEDYPEIAKNLTVGVRNMRKGIPDVMKGFSAMAQAALKPGAQALEAYDEFSEQKAAKG